MKKSLFSLHLVLTLVVGITNIYGGHSLSFDGVDDYATASSEAFNVSDLSISVRVKPSSNIPREWQGIVDKQPNSSSGYLLQLGPNGTYFDFTLATGSNYINLFSSLQPQPDIWYHVVVTYDGSIMKIYIDGVLDNEAAYEGSIIGNDDPLYVGSRGLMEPFEGGIDELALWSRVVSPEEISTNDFDSESLIAHWHMDEGTGNVCADESGNGFDLSIYDATWSTDVSPTPGEVSVDDVMVEELTLSFTSFQDIESSVLEEGRDYYLKISGSYSAAGGHNADAAYYYSNTPPAAAMPWTWNGLSTQHPYPQGYNEEHTYYYYFNSDGTTEQFGFEDTAYGDNSGSLTIQVWQRSEVTTVTDIDGNVYRTVVIGDQEWMAENLKVTKYRDGTAITNVTDNTAWGALTTEAYCFYNNNANNEAETYGALYNWYAVNDSRDIAPEGWHVPTDDEWKELEMYLGMSLSEADGQVWRGTNEGSKLAGNADLWEDGTLEADSEFSTSGFSALPGGYRHYSAGGYNQMVYNAFFWSANDSNSDIAWYRSLSNLNSDVFRYLTNKRAGYSVRCIKDTELAQTSNTHSLSFDGVDDYIPYIDGVEPAGSLSLCAWFKSGSTSNARLISKTSNENIFFLMLQADGALRFNVMDGQCITTSTFLDDQWHFAVGVWDGTNVKIYVDGVLEVEAIGTSNPNYTNVNTSKPFIGSQDPTWENFNGLIDEVSVWDVALSASQIQSFYTNPITGSESGLVGHWDFNEGSGTTVNDVTGNGYSGSIVGAVYSTDVPFTGSSTTSDLTWSIWIQGSQAGTITLNDVDNYLGVAGDATNAFDSAYDEAEPPASPGSSLSIYFPHPEWGHALGDDFSSDIRPEIELSDTMQVWNFDVLSTESGVFNMLFNFSNIPNVPVILEALDYGGRINLTDNFSSSFDLIANEARHFRISIGDTTAPEVNVGSSFSGPRILRAGHPHNLDFNAIDGFMIDQMDLLFSSDSGNSFYPFATFGDTTDHVWFAPDSFDNILYSAALQIKATDYAGNSATAESEYVLTIASDSLFSSVSNGWNLWGAPLTPIVDTMEINIDDDFEGYWTTYDYVDNGYTYDGYLNLGAGYWLGTLEGTEVDVLGTPSVSDETADLDFGWNLLSNPLVVDVYVDSLMVTNGNTSESLLYPDAVNAGWVNSIYSYDGNGYVEPSEILPWHGYWFSALTDNISITFPIHKHGEIQLARDIREEGWGLQIFASTSNGAEDNLLILGSHPEATNEFDNGFDEVRPPSAPGSRFVQLDVLHPEWALPLGDSFVRDIRAANVEGENEDWIVSTSSSEDDFSITWDISLVPEAYDVGIDLTGDGIFQDLTSFESISIVAGTEFTIRVGANALATDNLGLPTAFQMSQNYPNPFNPTTTIKYGLPTLSDVSIIIYDITGREVIRLVNAAQKPAGYYEVAWNGIDANHHPASTGLYFTRIVAGDFTKTVKMLYLK